MNLLVENMGGKHFMSIRLDNLNMKIINTFVVRCVHTATDFE